MIAHLLSTLASSIKVKSQRVVVIALISMCVACRATKADGNLHRDSQSAACVSWNVQCYGNRPQLTSTCVAALSLSIILTAVIVLPGAFM